MGRKMKDHRTYSITQSSGNVVRWTPLNDRWQCRKWDDGNCQVALIDGSGASDHHDYMIERVDKPKSRRKRWCIVDRDGELGSAASSHLYPPVVSGPFPTLEAAQAAYLILISLN